MIIRKNAGGGLTLITQTEHSRFVGQLAGLWGNKEFAKPTPFESVARAATYHDFMHLDWEPDLPFDAETGEPLEFRKLPNVKRQVAANQACIDWLTRIDAYSGLLVSMHATGLRRGRYGTIEFPTAFNPASLGPEMEEFIARNEGWQKDQETKQPPSVRTNFHLLQVWDLLGLYFGCEEPGEGKIDPVPTGYTADSPKVTLKMNALGNGKIAFDPFPFRSRSVKVQMVCKRLAQTRFPNAESFRSAYYEAPADLLQYELV